MRVQRILSIVPLRTSYRSGLMRILSFWTSKIENITILRSHGRIGSLFFNIQSYQENKFSAAHSDPRSVSEICSFLKDPFSVYRHCTFLWVKAKFTIIKNYDTMLRFDCFGIICFKMCLFTDSDLGFRLFDMTELRYLSSLLHLRCYINKGKDSKVFEWIK